MKIDLHIPAEDEGDLIPLFQEAIPAGAPAPAEGSGDDSIDLNRTLIRNPQTTVLAKIKDAGYNDAGLREGDTMIIDKAEVPKPHALVLCAVGNEFTVRRLIFDGGKRILKSIKEDESNLYPDEDGDVKIWGVITYVIKKT